MITHIPGVVNASGENAPLHYVLHVIAGGDRAADVDAGHRSVQRAADELWRQDDLPLRPERDSDRAGRLAHLRRRRGVQALRHPRAGVGYRVINDQQMAGAIMKVGGTMFLWTIIVFMFFKRFSAGFDADQTYRRPAASSRPRAAGHRRPVPVRSPTAISPTPTSRSNRSPKPSAVLPLRKNPNAPPSAGELLPAEEASGDERRDERPAQQHQPRRAGPDAGAGERLAQHVGERARRAGPWRSLASARAARRTG